LVVPPSNTYRDYLNIFASGSAFRPSMTIATPLRNVVQMIGASAVFLTPDELALLTAITDAAALIGKSRPCGVPGAAPGDGIESGLCESGDSPPRVTLDHDARRT
jgi:hypothetical protein